MSLKRWFRTICGAFVVPLVAVIFQKDEKWISGQFETS